MKNIKVKLIANSGINVFIDAVRTCWASHSKCDTTGDNVGENDKALIDRIV
ncbi:thymidylate synthase (FAD), partial [Campylobacter coli]|nr:thymidylate synthase (FAD) [Campylobacter coli]